jgi:hypothetical protein
MDNDLNKRRAIEKLERAAVRASVLSALAPHIDVTDAAPGGRLVECAISDLHAAAHEVAYYATGHIAELGMNPTEAEWFAAAEAMRMEREIGGGNHAEVEALIAELRAAHAAHVPLHAENMVAAAEGVPF